MHLPFYARLFGPLGYRQEETLGLSEELEPCVRPLDTSAADPSQEAILYHPIGMSIMVPCLKRGPPTSGSDSGPPLHEGSWGHPSFRGTPALVDNSACRPLVALGSHAYGLFLCVFLWIHHGLVKGD